MSETQVPDLTLHDGVEIPQLGFGVFEVPPEETAVAVAKALEVGYRHIDTAAVYRNEKGVAAAIESSGVPREEIFITTKLWNSHQGGEVPFGAIEKSLGRLGYDQVDLYLIHWPMPAEDLFVESWKALEKIRAEGKTRSIGVSNFRIEDLERLEREADLKPTVNQIELHPYLQQEELRAYHAEHGIVTEAWSPLARGRAIEDPDLGAIAAKHEKSTAQVMLRWHLELGNVVIPRSVTPSRIAENFDIFGFDLDAEDMAALAALDRGERVGPDPATFVTR
jgi:diketogulonate reductase-like aldo/keto reductase